MEMRIKHAIVKILIVISYNFYFLQLENDNIHCCMFVFKSGRSKIVSSCNNDILSFIRYMEILYIIILYSIVPNEAL